MADLNGYELTHKKIMDSGKANFLKDGYERANLRKICKDAGVTTGAFYRHFNDKEDLFISLVDPLAK
ncbi:TPA: TetR/AcrR family transcriptional regulator, partial [Streptococcus pyogenes]